MRIRRPLAALMISLAMFGGGTATLTACGSPSTPNEGTTDDGAGSENGEDTEDTTTENDEDSGDLPDNSDREPDQDEEEDQQDPD